jgi:hypothetical protein
MIAEGLLSPYKEGTETPKELTEWGLARIRQLSAHEVGHTLGIGHNYYSSTAGRISVMDNPQPHHTKGANGTLDYSKVYDVGIGAWDKVAITYAYSDFPTGTDEAMTLATILEEGHQQDLWYLSNQDTAAHPRVDTWSNGTDSTAELKRMMAIRKFALSRFGEQAIKRNEPMATIEDVLVPLYLHHRYQVEATTSTVGGIYFTYAMRGDGREPVKPAPAAEQRAALDAVLDTIKPSELALPRELLAKIPPRPSGYGNSRELFPRYTGQMFDAITPAVVASDMTLGLLLSDTRAARLVEQHALDPALPGLEAVIDQLLTTTFGATSATPYEAEIARAVQRVVVERLMTLASTADMPQVRAIASQKLQQRAQRLAAVPSTNAGASAHAAMLASDIKRFLDRPYTPANRVDAPTAPPGAPIGDPGMDWLGRLAPYCGWQ